MSDPCSLRRLVDAHFDATIDPKDERRMRAHLDGCASCRQRYDRQALFATLDPDALRAEERIGRGLGLTERPGVRRIGTWLGVVSALAAAATVFVLVHPRSEDAGYTARGGHEGSQEAGPAQVGPLQVYRVLASGPVPALDAVRRGDELAFAYENTDAKAYMMIFGVNDQGRVYWFYPAWTREMDTPTAIPIARTREPVPLPDAIRHDFVGSRLDVHALFTDAPLTVRAVETAIAAHRLPALGASDHVSPFRVDP